MQFALGSVLKLTRSAFGGLGSFRAPSIRRALPVLLGGLLCAVGSAAMAQTVIESIGVVSEPTGGAAATRGTAPDVYIIGDTVTFRVTYNANLSNVGTPILDITVGTVSKGATCAVASGDATSLLCSYEIKELDVAAAGTSAGEGVRVTGLRANTGRCQTTRIR